MDKEKIKNFIVTQRQNGVPDDQIYSFLQEKGAIAKPQAPEVAKETTAEKIAGFTGGKELAQGIGQALAQKEISAGIQDTMNQQIEIQGKLVKKLQEEKAAGLDTSKTEQALKYITDDLAKTSGSVEQQLNPNALTPGQVIGSSLQLATTIAGAGTYGKTATAGMKGGRLAVGGKPSQTVANLLPESFSTKAVSALPSVAEKATSAIGVGKGTLQGLKTGLATGTGYGASTGVAQGLREDLSADEIVKKGVENAIFGGVTGGILGMVTGGIAGGLKGRTLRNNVLENQIESGQKAMPVSTEFKQKAIEIAKQQGIDDTDILFIQSMKPQDRLQANKMIELAQKASTDKRILERPIDIVGDSMTKRIKFIQGKNSEAGKAVNEVAKSLRGQVVDANPIAEKATLLIDDLGITRTPTGKLNFDNSVFKNTPELQKKLNKFVTEIPTGQADAYDVHIFKKSIDELVDYGTKGEGLKGNSERILKALRASADDVLDNTFESYNKANTDFRLTKTVLDEANDLFGKKTGIGKERGGQLLRSVFSNNTQRPRVLKLVDALDATSKQYGGKFKDNLVDQALFTEILEDIYGTQATTALQGQVARAVKGTQKVIEGVRNPIKGVGELLATGTEKALGISPENKKKVLQSLLR